MESKSTFFSFLLSFFLVFSVEAQDCPESCSIYVPNVVTPDCDGVDCEYLTVRSECSFLSFEFKVYNRWGMSVFESDDPEIRFDSSEVDNGTYSWILEVTYCNEEDEIYRGQVTVVK